MKEGYINPIYKLSQIDPSTVKSKISYSQLAMYHKCPRQWKLSYIDKLAPFQHNINTCFGTAMHEVLQDFLTTMYTKSVTEANKLNLAEMLKNNLRDEYIAAVKDNNNEHFSTPAELEEYLEDGINILDWFLKRRGQYFSTKHYELVGIEVQLCTPASEKNPNVYMFGFIDIVLKDTFNNRIIVIDIKTSRMGWNKYQKADKLKAAQLVLYKKYYSNQFGIPVDNIDVEFFIVKRKIIEDSMFPQKRIQKLQPASGSVTQGKVKQMIDQFISDCFDSEGNKKTDRKYLPLAGKGAKNCKWCPFKTDELNCPKTDRIRE